MTDAATRHVRPLWDAPTRIVDPAADAVMLRELRTDHMTLCLDVGTVEADLTRIADDVAGLIAGQRALERRLTILLVGVLAGGIGMLVDLMLRVVGHG